MTDFTGFNYHNNFLDRLRNGDDSPEVDIIRRRINYYLHRVLNKGYKMFSYIGTVNTLVSSEASNVFVACDEIFSVREVYLRNRKQRIEDLLACIVYFLEQCCLNDPEYYGDSKINTDRTRQDLLIMVLHHIDEKYHKFIPKEFCDLLITHDGMINIVTNKDKYLNYIRKRFVNTMRDIYGEDEVLDLYLLLELEKIDADK